MPSTSQTHNELLHPHVCKEILAQFRHIALQDSRTMGEIQNYLKHYSPALIASAVETLVKGGELSKLQLTPSTTLYSRAPEFSTSHIVPLFASSWEWRIEDRKGACIAICPSEFTARLIANALNGERS